MKPTKEINEFYNLVNKPLWRKGVLLVVPNIVVIVSQKDKKQRFKCISQKNTLKKVYHTLN